VSTDPKIIKLQKDLAKIQEGLKQALNVSRDPEQQKIAQGLLISAYSPDINSYPSKKSLAISTNALAIILSSLHNNRTCYFSV
jgi:hypothetical protein